jgi:cobalt-zinc-cadmium efflux system outer membrane protein
MLKKVLAFFIISVMILEPVVVYAQGASTPQDVNDLIKEALDKNPEIIAAQKRLEAAKARVPQAKSWDDPKIGLTLEKIPRGTLKVKAVMPDDRMLSVSQMIPFFGKMPLKGKIAVIEAQMVAAEYKDTQLRIASEVKQAYYELFMVNKEIELKTQSLDFLKTIASVARAKYTVGKIEQEDVAKVNLEVASLSTDILNLREKKFGSCSRLTALLNRDGDGDFPVSDLSESVLFKADMKNLYAALTLNQPELLIFAYAIEKNKHEKALAKRNVFSDIMATLIQRGLTSGTIGPWDVMLSFSVPLWFWSKQRYEIKEAIANLEEAQAAYTAMKNKSFSEARALAAKIEISSNKIKLYQNDLIPLVEGSLHASMAAFQTGKGDFMMLLDSQRMLIEKRMEYYQALVEYNMNLADLERMIGVDLKGVAQ